MIISIGITLAVILTALAVCFVAGAAGLVAATFGGLLLTIKIDPKGLRA